MTDNNQHHNLHAIGGTNMADRTVLVHRQDAEGALIVNALTGQIAQSIDERPEWSDGLATALLGERLQWWTTRLGAQFTEEQKFPQAIAYEDLGWLVVSEDGESIVETDADVEFRMDLLANYMGLNRAAPVGSEEATHTKGTILAEVEIGMDQARTEHEASALEEAQTQGFDTKTGTHHG
jgi:hypothetical protein